MNQKPEITQRVVDAIAACGGNQSEAARRLNMTRSNVLHHIRRAQAAGIDIVAPEKDVDRTQRVLDTVAACGGNQREAAARLGVTRNTVQYHIQIAAQRKITPAAKPLDADALRRALLKGVAELSDLASRFGTDRASIITALDGLRDAGYAVTMPGGDRVWIDRDSMARPRQSDDRHTYTSREDGSFVFGFTSDNHLGSKYSREDVLAALFERFEAVGVDRVYNAGNYIDGEARFNKHDLLVHGMHAQARFLAQRWPRIDGITTYAVSGDDHEGWYAQREGVDIGRYVEMVMHDAGRDDWLDLGYMESDIALVHAKTGVTNRLRVVHPGGGSSYATSYAPQKYIESLQGGDKPGAALLGHYHKLHCINIRGVWVIQTGCFLGTTWIETDRGRKRIKDIREGDWVLTHRNRYRRVTSTMSRSHRGEMVTLRFGRRGPGQVLTATEEHPILTERAEGRSWVDIKDVQVGDRVFVKTTTCPVTGDRIPYWMKMSKNANPMDLPGVRAKLSATKGGYKTRTKGGSDGDKHLRNDVLPFCTSMTEQGWRMVPVGAGVIPDAIGFKDGKVVAFEVEKSTGARLAEKQSKYEGAPISAHLDAVEWIDARKPRLVQPRSWYEYDEETGMCKVLVIEKTVNPVRGAHGREHVTVYNFSVDEDESYVAGNIAVHNCTQDQTPFGRKLKLDFQVGGGICRLQMDPATGALTSCTVELMQFFNREFYGTGRWSHAKAVQMPERSITY